MIQDRRAYFRKGLSRFYLPYYDKLCELMPPHFQPIFGFRTFEEQADLYASGRTESGPIITNASAGFSMHNYGLATDWQHFKGKTYMPIPFEDPRWFEYTNICKNLGLRLISWEKPHNQLSLKLKPRELFTCYQLDGFEGVDKLIEEELNGQAAKDSEPAATNPIGA